MRVSRCSGRFGSPDLLRAVRSFGWVLIACQLIGMLWWSTVLTTRASMSWDYGIYYQPWWEIAHGHLDPLTTSYQSVFPFWRSDGEFIVWLLAPFYWVFPSHKLGFWWLQDFAYVGISIVCFRWIMELLPGVPAGSATALGRPVATPSQAASPPPIVIAAACGDARRHRLIAATGWLVTACLLVFNPWVYWGATFAFQIEPFGVLLALLALRALMSSRRSLWVWALLTALCGPASLIYLTGAGLAGLASQIRPWYQARRGDATSVVDRRRLVRSAAILLGAVMWLLALGAIGAVRTVSAQSSVHRGLAYLLGSHSSGGLVLVHVAVNAVSHPGKVASVIWSHALNLWANTAPAGFVGLASVPGFFLSAPTLLENSLLQNQNFSYPGFANLIVFSALAVGTALVVASLLRRHRTAGLVLAGVVIANSIAWFAIWLPKVSNQYVRISPAAALSLRQAAKRIPGPDEVIASQGFVGAFAAHKQVFSFGSPRDKLAGPEVFPVNSRRVWFVLSADQGIEGPSTAATDQAIGSVATLPGASLVSDADGVWIFKWLPQAGTSRTAIGGPRATIPAWISAGSAANVRLSGSVADWTTTSKRGTAGYVVSGDIWRLGKGRYVADVSLSSNSRANVEIWNDSTDGYTLLGRVELSSKRMRTVAVPFSVPTAQPAATSAGTAPFAYEPQPPPSLTNIEIRIWTPGTGKTTVGKLGIRRALG